MTEMLDLWDEGHNKAPAQTHCDVLDNFEDMREVLCPHLRVRVDMVKGVCCSSCLDVPLWL